MKIKVYTLATDSPDDGTECEVFETQERLADALAALVRKSHPTLADMLDSVSYGSAKWCEVMDDYDAHRDPLITYVEGEAELDLLVVMWDDQGAVRTAEQGLEQEEQCRKLHELVTTPRPGEIWFFYAGEADMEDRNVWCECRIVGTWHSGSKDLAFHVKDLSCGDEVDRVVCRVNLRWKPPQTVVKA